MKNPLHIAWILVLMLALKATCKIIDASVKNNYLTLKCNSASSVIWKHNNEIIEANNTDLDLGSLWNDPRGTYSCKASENENEKSIEVFVRMCQNCIELDTGTISGFIVADIIMIGLIAIAVYCVSGSESRRPARGEGRIFVRNPF
ncbi:hypothetical protein XENTR_v10018762 [Xenopus tropicalis]|nr:hypothetical protein XENTR_v10018762 [Xenopus tropicalis]